MIDALVRKNDLSSYYVSTQAKIQIFRALVKQAEKTETLVKKDIEMAFR
jgi:hypothetical protein